MGAMEIGLLFLAGFVSGAINAVAGGGTFIAFGALSLLGVPPISANATSSIAQLPGYFTSTLAYWSSIRQVVRSAVFLAIASMVGSLCGALFLLWLSNDRFAALVPWLLLAATALFAAGPWLKPKPTEADDETQRSTLASIAVQSIASIYGGFFGAGMGIMMLATLGLTEGGDYHRLNALKNLLSNVIAIVAIVVFISGGVISWPGALAMIPGVALGGYGGVWAAKRVPQTAVRMFVIAVGLFLAGYYFWRG
ncbi:sulfite exporter TauE/SafE family protein [Notoacmeibacter sp. MSK16QG-6]|uniref:sulfite exporter TauE/SafE family protein n=1 Tax=Notoacmeibacter sp. MSK16QG-6 TaxID=2957982 RepID=UPI00209D9531|nr:sulfite exporter TauE/SafE family protein [Notoacmeibacter sp. MSK16QG-6]MCP1198163.1 sulfite exporter TauE/SafE family protein [Notoacmeibacter sp. MSK16QG-6]